MGERWLTIDEITQRLGVSGQTVRRWVKRFKLPRRLRPRRGTLDAVTVVPWSAIERLLHRRVDNGTRLVPLREAARELGVSERTIRYWLAKGAPHCRAGRGRFFFVVDELREWRKSALRRRRRGNREPA